MTNSTLKHIMLGAVSEEVTRNLSMYGLGKAGAYYNTYVEHNGKYIWGIGTNDVLSAAIGGALALGGKGKYKEMGYGWLLGLGLVKLVAEPLYGLIMAYDPVWPQSVITGKISAASTYRNTYAGQVSPQPSPFAPPANPQDQLIVGSKAGTGKADVYKPNVSAPPCAGTHASDQMLFV